ncbi:MAG: hypothetical protein ACJ74Q_15435 [Pyrinomonadaceae bacterium]
MTKADIRVALNRSMVAGLVIGVAVGMLTFAAGVLGGIGVLGVTGVIVLTVCFGAAGACCAVFALYRIVRVQRFRITEEHLLALFAGEVLAALGEAEGAVINLPVDAVMAAGTYILPMLGRKHERAKGLEGIAADLPRLRKLLGDRVSADLVRYNALLNGAVEDLRRRFVPEELNYLIWLSADSRVGDPDSLLNPVAGVREAGKPRSLEQYAERGLLPGAESMEFLSARIGEMTMLDHIALAYLGESATYQHMKSGLESGLNSAAA